jgi:hypothetical protein
MSVMRSLSDCVCGHNADEHFTGFFLVWKLERHDVRCGQCECSAFRERSGEPIIEPSIGHRATDPQSRGVTAPGRIVTDDQEAAGSEAQQSWR